MEHWRDIEGHPNHEVSDLGRVRNKKTGRIMKQFETRNGYMQTQMDKKSERIHRLVATAFYPGDHEGLEVNHKDTDKRNNRADNLEWTTRSENIVHSFQHGVRKSNLNNDLRRKGNKIATEKMSKPVLVLETGECYPSVHECAREFKCSPAHIRDCCLSNAKSYTGYHFAFK